jgi:hypothetical protein
VDLRLVEPKDNKASWSRTWTVQAKVAEPLDVEIVKAVGTWTLREWVRRCWKIGSNPRVYNPFLPHGFEEREGISYHGEDLRRRTP